MPTSLDPYRIIEANRGSGHVFRPSRIAPRRPECEDHMSRGFRPLYRWPARLARMAARFAASHQCARDLRVTAGRSGMQRILLIGVI